MNTLKTTRFLLTTIVFSLVFSNYLFSQNDNNDNLELTVSGSGSTQKDAIQKALQIAIYETTINFFGEDNNIFADFSIFQQISPNIDNIINIKELSINEQLKQSNTKSEGSSILNFKILNRLQLSNGIWFVTLKTNIFLGNLMSFIISKGAVVDKPSLYGKIIKNQILHEKIEYFSIVEMYNILQEYWQKSYDYNISTEQPIQINSNENKWAVPTKVLAIPNKNYTFCSEFLIKTLSYHNLDNMDNDFRSSYLKSQKEIFDVKIKVNATEFSYILCNKKSFEVLVTLLRNSDSYLKSFNISNGFTTQYGGSMNWGSSINEPSRNRIEFIFPLDDKKFIWDQNLSLKAIEKISKYEIKSSAYKDNSILTETIENKEWQLKKVDLTVSDIDGNIYHTVKISDQIWMVENLRVTHYQNGDSINLGVWVDYDYQEMNSVGIITPDIKTIKAVGHLYDWRAVSDSRNVAPKGWHVPTIYEWNKLIEFCGGKEIAAITLKDANTKYRAYNDNNVEKTNESGFCGLLSGYRAYSIGGAKPFYSYGTIGFWWSSDSWVVSLNTNSNSINTDRSTNNYGYSIRCIKD